MRNCCTSLHFNPANLSTKSRSCCCFPRPLCHPLHRYMLYPWAFFGAADTVGCIRRSLLANSPLKNEFERKYSHARSHSHNDWDHGHHHDHHHHGNDHHGHRHSHSRSPARGGKSMQQGPPQSMGAFGNDLSDLRRDVHSAWEMRDGKHVKGDKTGFPFDITSGNHGGVGSLRYHDRSECQEVNLTWIRHGCESSAFGSSM